MCLRVDSARLCHASWRCPNVTGDLSDFVQRLKSTLPRRWFGDDTPVLDQVLRGPASTLSQCYAVIQQIRRQVRIHLADGYCLDTLARDYLGLQIARRVRESDSSFRIRIMRDLVRSRATRASLTEILRDTTGRPATVFEPANPKDTGGYCGPGSNQSRGMGYNLAGGWGSLYHSNQCFVTAFRPVGVISAAGRGWGSGGYNIGYSAYSDLSILRGLVSDEDIHSAICSVLPVGTVAWLRIQS